MRVGNAPALVRFRAPSAPHTKTGGANRMARKHDEKELNPHVR
jgi:hypothetical protein